MTSESPASNATGVAVSSPVSATFSEAVQPGTISFTVVNSAGTSVAGSLAYNSTTNTETFTPKAALAYGTTYTTTVSGAEDTSGDPMSGSVSWSFTTDPAQPAVSSHTPASGANGVAVSATPSATFNEAVQAGTVTFTLATSAGTAVAGTASYNTATNTETFTPKAALAYGTTYTATVSGAEDTTGDSMNGSVSWSFTTDPLQPAVSTHTPASGASGLAVSSIISATFNEAVQAGTIAFTLTNSAGAAVAGTVSYASATDTATFSPSTTLEMDTSYTATVSGAQDTDGDPMSGSTTWTFTTDAITPAVSSHTPAAGATGVAVAATPTATFNEGMQAASIVFTLTTSTGTAVAGTLSYNGSTDTDTFMPTAPLAYGATYTATIGGGKNTDGDPMTGSTTWSFTTDPQQPAVTSYSPASSTTGIPVTSAVTATFNEAVQFSTVTFTLTSSAGAVVAGALSYNSTTNTETFKSSVALAYGTTYTATVSGAEDTDGDPMSGSTSWSFSTDPLQPAVSSVSPAAGATGVAVGSAVSASFNEAVQAGAISFTLTGSTGTSVAGALAYSSKTNTETFTPTSALAPGTYTATISGATDTAGDPMSGPVTWSFSTVGAITLQTGLVAEWQFNEGSGTTTADSTGDGHTGTLAGSVSWTTGLVGPYALSFSSSNDGHVSVPDSSSLDFSATQSYSLSAWVDVPSLPNAWSAVVEKSRETGSDFYGIWINPSNQWVAGYNNLNGSQVSTGWSLVTIVQNGSAGTRGLYVDGVEVASGAAQAANATGALWIGGDPLGEAFNGTIDDVRLYDIALSNSLVQSLYAAGTPAVSGESPANGATDIAVSSSVTATFSEPIQASTLNMTMASSSGTAVAGSITYNASTDTATLVPSSALAAGTTYTVTLSGAENDAGLAMSTPVTWSFTTAGVATPPPSVSSETPAPQSTGVAVSAPLSVTFNEAVQSGSVTFTLVNSAGTSVAVSSSYNATTDTETYTPTAALAYGTIYTATVSGAKNTSGLAMTGPYSWSFTTDPVQPAVSSETPPSEATGVAVASLPSVTFNEAVQFSTINFALKNSAGIAVSGTLSYHPATFTAVFTPATALAYGMTYTATVSGAEDTDGDPMSGSTSWSFSTDPLQPAVSSVSPASGATGAAVSSLPSATFNEAVQTGSVTFTLATSAGTAVAGTASYSPTTSTETFTPTAALAYGTTYTATVSGAIDTAGDPMSGPVTWSFTTASVPTLQSGLVAEWQFNEGSGTTTADSTGDGHTGTLAGSVSWTTGLVGPNALSFSSSNDGHVSVPDSSSLDFSATQSYSLSAWVYVPSLPNGWTAIVEKSRETGSNFYGIWINPSNQWVAGNNNLNGSQVSTGWSLVTIVQNGSAGTRGLYVDGVEVASGAAQAANATGALWIGGDPIGEAFNGTIDDVRLYNIALSNSLVQSLYTAGTPAVTGETPANGAKNVAVSSAVTATFNEPIQASTINLTMAGSAGNAVAGSVTYNSSTETATLVPSSALVAGTTYTVTLSGAENNAGMAMSAPVTWSFTTAGVAPPAPTVTSETPAPKSTGVAVSAPVTVTFNEAVQSGSITFTLVSSAGSSVAVSPSYNATTNTETFTPTAALAYGTTYTATVSGVTSTLGAVMNGSTSWSFTTDPLQPAVSSHTPASGATGVAVSSIPGATFNEAVQAGTVTFTLATSGGTAVAGTASYNATTNTETFTPKAALAYGTTYTVTVSGAEDSIGDAMNGSTSWSFTTDPLQPAVSSHTPASGASGVAVSSIPGATFNEAVQAGTVTFTLATSGGTAVAGTASYNATTNTETFTPKAALAYGTTYTATVSGAEDSIGDAMNGSTSWSFTTDPLQPAVSSHTPASGATGVAVSSLPGATFNEAVQAGTVTFTLATSGGTAVAGTASYNATTNTETFTPKAALAYGTTYTATVSGAEDSIGDPMNGSTSWSFTTDPLQPAVTSYTPASGAAGVAVSTAPTATFNEAVQSGTVTFTLATSGGTAVAGTASYNATTNTETFTPAAALGYGTKYTATVSGAKDAAGDPMSGSTSWSFTTDALQPAVSSHTPASGAMGVPVSSAPTATFNEAVQLSTISFIVKTSSGSSVPGSISYSSTTNTATFTPTAALKYNTSYMVTVSGAKDMAGDPMSGSTSWSFTTDPLQLVVSSHTPASGATGVAVSTAPSASFDEKVQTGTIVFTVKTSAGATVAGTLSYHPATYLAVFTPSKALAYSTTYTATVSGALDSDGDPLSGPVTWSFTTVAGIGASPGVESATAAPATSSPLSSQTLQAAPATVSAASAGTAQATSENGAHAASSSTVAISPQSAPQSIAVASLTSNVPVGILPEPLLTAIAQDMLQPKRKTTIGSV